MAPTLYMVSLSPPVRAVLMTAKAIGLTLNEKEVNVAQGEQLTPEYLKMNPQHTVPTLVDDDGFVVWDSHAIITYLVSKYAKKDSLYPKDLKKRAVVDQRLHFESGVLFATLRNVLAPVFREGKNAIDQKGKDSVSEVYAFLEAFLEGKKWAAGDSVTVADYSLISSVSTFNAFIPFDAEKFPKVADWIKRVEALPEYEANLKGLEAFSGFIKSKLTQ